MKRFPRAERARPTSRARRSPSSSVLYTVMGAVVVWSGLFAGLGRAVAAQTPPLPRTMPAPAPAARAATSPGLTQLFDTVRDAVVDAGVGIRRLGRRTTSLEEVFLGVGGAADPLTDPRNLAHAGVHHPPPPPPVPGATR